MARSDVTIFSSTDALANANAFPLGASMFAVHGGVTASSGANSIEAAISGGVIIGAAGSASAVANFIITAVDTTWDGVVEGVFPGAIIQIEAGVRGALRIDNVFGTALAPVIIRGDPAGLVTIRRTNAAAGDFVLRFNNIQNVIIDGSYVPGVTYGIKIMNSINGFDTPSSFFKLIGICQDYTVRNIEVDGNFPADSGNGIGFSHNDASVTTVQQAWRENMVFEYCKVANVQGEGFYIGPNYANHENVTPLRNLQVRYCLTNNCGREGINVKSTLEGFNSIHHCTILNSGTRVDENQGLQKGGIAYYEGSGQLHNNWIENSGEHGIVFRADNRPPSFSLPSFIATNNIIINSGVDTTPIALAGRGISVSARTGATVPAATAIYNNTIVTTEDDGIFVSSNISTIVNINNNIIADAGTNAIDDSSTGGGDVSNNQIGTIAQQFFNNAALNDYSLTLQSPALDNALTGNTTTTDFNGEVRPNGPAIDQGALELNQASNSLTFQCSAVGTSNASPPEITGTTHFIDSTMDMDDVRALSTSPGDGVLFQAGQSWSVTGNGNRLLVQNGVKYGRYGVGNNPLITAQGVVLSNRFNGLIEGLIGQDNIIIDGIDVTHPGGNNFMIWLKDTNGATVRNLTVHNDPATDPLSNGGIILTGVNNVNIINCYLHDLRGNPHETISITGGSTNVLVDSVKVERCGHAAINTKGACDGVEVRFSEFSTTTNDPMVYVDRSINVRYHHNFIHTSSSNPSTTFKPLMALGLEGLGGNSDRFNRNIEFDHNVIFSAERVALKVSIKWDAFDASTGGSKLPFPVMDNIHFHHNTIYRNISNIAAVSFVDNRDDPRTTGGGQDASDWLNFVCEDNIIFDMGNANSLSVDTVISSGNTFRFNLFETGASSNNFGSNPIFTNDVRLVDVAGGDFTLEPTSPAIGAAHDGSNIGADLGLICPLSN